MSVFGRQSRFMSPALKDFPPNAIRAFFRRLGVETCEEPDGCVFPASQKASDILNALEQAARASGAEIRCGVRATRLVVEPATSPDGPAGSAPSQARIVAVDTDHGLFPARRVILAAGGQSYPDLGSDGSGFALARGAGLAVVAPVPALTGLTTLETWPAELAGIVLEHGGMRLAAKGSPQTLLTGPLLFTHKGLSGPPALALSGEIASRLLRDGQGKVPIRVSFIAERSVSDWLALFEGWRLSRGGRALHNLLSGELPRALATAVCTLADVKEVAVARARKSALEALATACADLPLQVTGTDGWNRAMLTRGGVALSELDPRTLGCRRIAGLYCAGELVDLDGPCGGYNLTWALASGRLAGGSA
jgi:predicted Rossmann fold flavoprotein